MKIEKIIFSLFLEFLINQIKVKANNLRKLHKRYNTEVKTLEEQCNNSNIPCFECNSPLNSCFYNKDQCIYSSSITESTENFWYTKLMTCKDNESKTKMEQYCGQLIYDNSQRKVIIDGSELYGSNSINNLFCSWEISDSKKLGNIKISFKNINSNTYLGFFIVDSDTHTYYEIDSNFSKKISSKDYHIIQIIYFHSDKPNKSPFTMDFKTNIGIKFSDVALYFIIAFGFFFIVISMITLILFIKKFSQNQKTKKKRFEIEKLSTIKYSNDLNIYNQTCPICLDEIKKDMEIILLNCNHGFHVECIMNWIKNDIAKNRHCPICNTNFKENQKEKN